MNWARFLKLLAGVGDRPPAPSPRTAHGCPKIVAAYMHPDDIMEAVAEDGRIYQWTGAEWRMIPGSDSLVRVQPEVEGLASQEVQEDEDAWNRRAAPKGGGALERLDAALENATRNGMVMMPEAHARDLRAALSTPPGPPVEEPAAQVEREALERLLAHREVSRRYWGHRVGCDCGTVHGYDDRGDPLTCYTFQKAWDQARAALASLPESAPARCLR